MKKNEPTEIETAVRNSLTHQIIGRVMDKMAFHGKKGIVLFTGAAIGFSQSLRSLEIIQEGGMDLTVYITGSAWKVLPEDHIKEVMNRSVFACDKDRNNMRKKISSADIFIIPTLTVNTAAKIACGFTDSLASYMTATALQKGVPVIAVRDGSCPYNKERKETGFRANDGYIKMMSDNLDTLESFGARLVDSGDLAAVCREMMLENVFRAKEETEESNISFTKKLITKEDVDRIPAGGSIKISKNTMITALANDELKAKNVTVKDLAGE